MENTFLPEKNKAQTVYLRKEYIIGPQAEPISKTRAARLSLACHNFLSPAPFYQIWRAIKAVAHVEACS